MQFRRQGTKIFIKLELKNIHIFILQYSFIQLLLILKRRFTCIQVQIGCIGYMRINNSDIYVNHKRTDIV